jgi:phosphotriesterase-related protein
MTETIDEEPYQLKMENLAFLRDGGFAVSDACLYHNDDREYMVGEFRAFKAAGGSSIVDASPIGIRGNVEHIREAAERAGVNVVCCTGLYIAEGRPAETKGWSVDDMVRAFKQEIEEGIDSTEIHPGFVKCAQNTVDWENNSVAQAELDTIRACARVAAENGMSLHIHHNNVSDAQILEAADIVIKECGVKPERLLMLHMDNRIKDPVDSDRYMSEFDYAKRVSIDVHLTLLDQGINIGFDSWGSCIDYLPHDHDRLKALIELLRRGYTSQIVLGHDFNNRVQAKAYGAYGMTRILTYVPQILRGYRFGQETMDQMLVKNPARILAY